MILVITPSGHLSNINEIDDHRLSDKYQVLALNLHLIFCLTNIALASQNANPNMKSKFSLDEKKQK